MSQDFAQSQSQPSSTRLTHNRDSQQHQPLTISEMYGQLHTLRNAETGELQHQAQHQPAQEHNSAAPSSTRISIPHSLCPGAFCIENLTVPSQSTASPLTTIRPIVHDLHCGCQYLLETSTHPTPPQVQPSRCSPQSTSITSSPPVSSDTPPRRRPGGPAGCRWPPSLHQTTPGSLPPPDSAPSSSALRQDYSVVDAWYAQRTLLNGNHQENKQILNAFRTYVSNVATVFTKLFD